MLWLLLVAVCFASSTVSIDYSSANGGFINVQGESGAINTQLTADGVFNVIYDLQQPQNTLSVDDENGQDVDVSFTIKLYSTSYFSFSGTPSIGVNTLEELLSSDEVFSGHIYVVDKSWMDKVKDVYEHCMITGEDKFSWHCFMVENGQTGCKHDGGNDNFCKLSSLPQSFVKSEDNTYFKNSDRYEVVMALVPQPNGDITQQLEVVKSTGVAAFLPVCSVEAVELEKDGDSVLATCSKEGNTDVVLHCNAPLTITSDDVENGELNVNVKVKMRCAVLGLTFDSSGNPVIGMNYGVKEVTKELGSMSWDVELAQSCEVTGPSAVYAGSSYTYHVVCVVNDETTECGNSEVQWFIDPNSFTLTLSDPFTVLLAVAGDVQEEQQVVIKAKVDDMQCQRSVTVFPDVCEKVL